MFCLFHTFKPSWEKLYQNPEYFFSVIPRGVPLLHSNALQYYIKREKCKVNDVIFPSGCEARAINLGNKNMKVSMFTGCTSVRSKNIFTDISQYPTRKHETIITSITLSYSVLHHLNSFPNGKFQPLQNWNSFQMTNFEFDENGGKISKRLENTGGKGEIARYKQFLFFPQYCQKTCT